MSDSRTIDRRTALRQIAVGGAVIATVPMLDPAALADAVAHVHAPAPPAPVVAWKPLFFDPHQNETVVALTELIIPATDTPGAKAARVNEFIDLVLSAETESVRRRFATGLAWLDGRSRELFGRDFKDARPEEQTKLVETLASASEGSDPGAGFFKQIKTYTINGYYTSEIGLIRELGYKGNTYLDEFPGCTHPEHQS
jgi:hypothetical protein